MFDRFESNQVLWSESNKKVPPPSVKPKNFKIGDYNGPQVADFIARIESIKETTVFQLENNQLEKKTALGPNELEERKRRVQVSFEKMCDVLKKECSIEPQTLDELLNQEQDVIKTIKHARKYIHEFVQSMIAILEPEALYDKKAYKKKLKEFITYEARYLLDKKGRPNRVNTYEIETPLSKITRVSMARPIYEKTTPSTIRTQSETGDLPNFVQCGVGYVDKGKYIEQFQGYRHSSLPPIDTTDQFERYKHAYSGVMSMIEEMIRQNPDQTTLNISTLTLLVPYAIYEEPQIKESYDVLMSFHGQYVQYGDKHYLINTNFLNMGMNAFSLTQSSHSRFTINPKKMRLIRSTETIINTLGMTKFIIDGQDFLQKSGLDLPSLDKNLSLEATNNSEKIHRKYIELTDALNIQNIALHNILTAETRNDREFDACVKEIDRLTRRIEVLARDNLNRIEQHLTINRNKMSDALIEIKRKLLQTPSSLLTFEERNALEVAQLYYEAIMMYFDQKVQTPEVGVRYLMANQKMGHQVDFYCKSGEDRTGRMQNLVEEMCEFLRQKQHYPRYDFVNHCIETADKDAQAQIGMSVMAYSVSKDIANDNAPGARGLQLKRAPFDFLKTILVCADASINMNLPTESSTAMGGIAKKVYDPESNSISDSISEGLSKSLFNTPSASDVQLANAIRAQRAQAIFEEKTDKNYISTLCKKDEIEGELTRPLAAVHSASLSSVTSKGAEPDKKAIRLDDQAIIIKKQFANTATPVTIKLIETVDSVANVSELTEHSQLSEAEKSECALEQAFRYLSPPFKVGDAVRLSGTDTDQVSKIHAALLYFKISNKEFKDLHVTFMGGFRSPKPVDPTLWSSSKKDAQYKNHVLAFVAKELGNDKASIELRESYAGKMKEWLEIEKQKSMKLLLQSGRSDESGLLSGINFSKT